MDIFKKWAESRGSGEVISVTVEEAAQEEAVEETETIEEVTSEEVSEVTEGTNEEVVEDVKEVVSEEAVVEETKPAFDPKSWLEENEDSLLSYLQAKRTDYSSMDNETVVKNKLKAEHPEWDDQEIAQELADKFGVGLKKIEIDREQMTDEEIKEAESINKSIERGQRLLKTEAHKAREFFEEQKKSLQAPELNLPVSENDPELTQQEYLKLVEEKTKEWEGRVTSSVQSFTNLSKTITFEDNGAPVELSVDYKLSDKQKGELENYLKKYVAHPEADVGYLQEDGTPDMQRFVSDKAEKLFFDQILKSALKEYGAQVRKAVVKNDLLNHDDGVNNRPKDAGNSDSLASAASKFWQSKRGQLV